LGLAKQREGSDVAGSDDLVSELEAAGLTIKQINLVLRRMLDQATALASSAEFRGHSMDEQAERRRAADRQRKRDKRVSAEIPQNSAEVPQTESLSLLEEDSLNKDSPKKERKRSRNVRGHSAELPPDWQPNDRHFAQGLELGFGREAVLGMAEDMRLWASAHAARKSDWSANFSSWMRRVARSAPGAGGQLGLPMMRSIAGGNRGRKSLADTADELIARAKEREGKTGARVEQALGAGSDRAGKAPDLGLVGAHKTG